MIKEGGTTAVQVALRIRPLTDRDRAKPRFANLSHDDVLKIHSNTVQVVPQNKLFTFDHVFGTTSTQDEIFAALGEGLIRKFVEGYNITILAYGQTSSGKTYTMGTAADGVNTVDEGIVPRSMSLLFEILNNNEPTRPISPTSSISSSTSASNKSASRLRPKSKIAAGNRSSHIPNVPNPHKTKFTVKVSFIEIYNEDLYDLLNSAPMEELPPITIREDTKGRIYWTGVKEVPVHSADDVLNYLEQGTRNRATGATDMNEKSSRSHAIFSVSLKQEKWVSSNVMDKKRPTSSMSSRSSITPKSSRLSLATQEEEGEWLITTSKFHFVDLAGSERLKKTAAEGDRRKEGININAGLLALGNVISALGDPSKKTKVHVPYRDSKLTRLLQDSLGGSATTLMIACASPVENNLAETLNTLQYANRARNIKNRSEKNQVEEWITTDNIETLRSMVGRLKQELVYFKHNGSPTSLKEDDDMDNEAYHDQRMLISDLQRQIEELDGEASVTRERNRMVEKELQRVRMLESMKTEQNGEDFQHLVEPVIEEYEKSVSKLESQLALTRAALNHSDMGHEEQQSKLTQLDALIRSQEQTISELRLRLSKVLEREQSNEGYIQELETKLMKSSKETAKDQEMLNELKNRIMKSIETDENTEQYIHSLEQRLAAGDTERTHLRTCIEDLEAKIEAKERSNVELLKRLSKTTSDTSTEKLILKELDEVNAKYATLEKERNTLQQQVKLLEKDNHRFSSSSSTQNSFHDVSSVHKDNSMLEDELKRTSISSPSKYSNRKSFADETETASSIAALGLLQAETKVREETERANRLQLTLDSLQYDHQETLKELDEVLQRYHESLEQLDFLERDSSSTTANEEEPLPKSLDLSKEIAQAKEDAHEQEKQAYLSKIKDLESTLSRQTIDMNSIQKLEHDLSVANKQIFVLKQMESEHKATAEVEDILEKLESPSVTNDSSLLEAEKQKTSYWKTAHNELKNDMDKMALDLDEKESFIAELKEQLEESKVCKAELQASLDESNQQATNLQKRLAETLASLTVLKIAHDSLTKTKSPSVDTANYMQEKELLLNKHQSELAQIRRSMEEIDSISKSTSLDKDAALKKIAALELELQEKIAESQHNSYLEQERLVQQHDDRMLVMTQEHQTQVNALTEKIDLLEAELELAKNTHQEAILIHNQRLKDATLEHTSSLLVLEEQIHSLQSELTKYHDLADSIQSEHVQQMSILTSELSTLRDLHNQRIQTLTEEHQSALATHGSQHEALKTDHARLVGSLGDQSQQYSEIEAQFDALKSDHKQQQANYDSLNQQNRQVTNHFNELTSAHSELNAKHEHITGQLNSLQSELDEWKELHAEQEVSYTNLKSQYDTLLSSQELSTMSVNEQVSALQQEVEQTKLASKGELSKKETEYSNLKAQYEAIVQSEADLRARLIVLEAQLKEVQAHHQTELELNKSEQEDANALLRRDHDLLETQYAEELEMLRTDHSVSQSKLQAAMNETESLQLQLDALQEEHSCRLAKIVSLESELRTAENSSVTLAQMHSEDVAKHATAQADLVKEITEKHTNDIELLRREYKECQDIVYKQKSTINEHVTKIESLVDEISKLKLATTDDKDRHILVLGKKLEQAKEENMEYTNLSEELEKEIHRMTAEKEALAEDLDTSEEQVLNYQQRIQGIQSALNVESDDLILPKIQSILKEHQRSTTAAAKLNNETQGDGSSVVNDNGSGAISQISHVVQLQQELKNCQKEIESLSDTIDGLKIQLEKEGQKLMQSTKDNRKLEKQLEEALKKKSFLCF